MAAISWKQGLRRVLLNLHLYGGDIFSWNLALLGVSAIVFNHLQRPEKPTMEWSSWQSIEADARPGACRGLGALHAQLYPGIDAWPVNLLPTRRV